MWRSIGNQEVYQEQRLDIADCQRFGADFSKVRIWDKESRRGAPLFHIQLSSQVVIFGCRLRLSSSVLLLLSDLVSSAALRDKAIMG